jgi:peptidoglycan/xylan/chitin deacetylase (PgdA/CDA1 family)
MITKFSWETIFRLAVLAWVTAVVGCAFLPLPLVVRLAIIAVLTIGAIAFSAQRTWWFLRVSAKLPVFLMLHSISDDVKEDICPNNTVRPAELERLIVDLKTAGYVFQTATEAATMPVRRSMVMTFDDGFVDNYTDLFPILKRHNVKATCFITNRGETDPQYLTPAQVREMHASGLVEFGGHTAQHSTLSLVTPEASEEAIRENVKWLTDILGCAPKGFAYPCGAYNDLIVEQVKAAGYEYAFTMHKRMRAVAKAPLLIHRQIIPRGKTPLQNYLLATRGRCRL